MREVKLIIHEYPAEKPTVEKRYLAWTDVHTTSYEYVPEVDKWNAFTWQGEVFSEHAIDGVIAWAEIPEV